MALFLNAAAAYSEIESIVNRAERKLVLISPYVRVSRVLFQRLYHAGQTRGVHVTIVCRKKDLLPDEYANFRKISWLEVLDLPNLHAKCFYNERAMVITSLNLYAYAQANNREMGVLLTQEKDPAAFADAVNEAESIVQTAFQLEEEKMYAAYKKKRASENDISFFDIEGGLKRSFPTFTKILTRK
jgi:phosphatidylserine/phosphatidylglycerophosphate/cardiolipin synthase-like enzyme